MAKSIQIWWNRFEDINICIPEDQAKLLVKLYREAHPEITAIWKKLLDAVEQEEEEKDV